MVFYTQAPIRDGIASQLCQQESQMQIITNTFAAGGGRRLAQTLLLMTMSEAGCYNLGARMDIEPKEEDCGMGQRLNV